MQFPPTSLVTSCKPGDDVGACPGAKFLDNEEAKMVGDMNMRHSHATHDLYNAIANGEYPGTPPFSLQRPLNGAVILHPSLGACKGFLG